MTKDRKVPYSRKRAIAVVTIIAVLATAGVLIGMTMRPSRQQAGTQTNTPGVTVRSADAIQKDITTTNDSTKKANLYSELVVAQQLDGDAGAALDASVKSTEARETADSYAVTAGLYQAKGDNVKALEYYKKALALSEPTDDPNLNVPYNNYKQYIIALGGSV